MYTGSDLAAWWEKNHRESEEALNEFVDAHPHLWVLAATTATLMDVGAGTVDLLRFGEGAAKSYDTGKIAPLIHDLLRGIGIVGMMGGLAQEARPLLGKLKLYSDPGGGICVPMSIRNALRRTGQKFLLSLDEIADSSGVSLPKILEKGLHDPEMLRVLRKLGVKYAVKPWASSLQELTDLAKNGDGVVTLPLKAATGPGHMALLERAGREVRIVDRSGIYKDLSDLSKRYGTTFTVDTRAPAALIRNVTARLIKGVGTLMVYADGIVVKLEDHTKLPQLDAQFQAFRKSRGAKSPASNGASGGW